MKSRKKMCKHCAFRNGSIETSTPERREDLIYGCSGRIFYCHETKLDIAIEALEKIASFCCYIEDGNDQYIAQEALTQLKENK